MPDRPYRIDGERPRAKTNWRGAGRALVCEPPGAEARPSPRCGRGDAVAMRTSTQGGATKSFSRRLSSNKGVIEAQFGSPRSIQTVIPGSADRILPVRVGAKEKAVEVMIVDRAGGAPDCELAERPKLGDFGVDPVAVGGDQPHRGPDRHTRQKVLRGW